MRVKTINLVKINFTYIVKGWLKINSRLKIKRGPYGALGITYVVEILLTFYIDQITVRVSNSLKPWNGCYTNWNKTVIFKDGIKTISKTT